MNLYVRTCGSCKSPRPEKGRAADGRRAYRCRNCGNQWTEGLQGCSQRFSPQREGNQFHDTGASRARYRSASGVVRHAVDELNNPEVIKPATSNNIDVIAPNAQDGERDG